MNAKGWALISALRRLTEESMQEEGVHWLVLRSVDWLYVIASKAFGSSASALPVAFDYQYNAANQRTRVNREDGAYWVYQYDDLGQVISGRKYWGDGTEVAGQQFDYAFDTIGNRTETGGRASAVSTYTPNRLNQYSQRTVPAVVDVQGVASPTANVTVRVIGGTTYTAARKGEYYHHALNVGNNVYPQVEVKSLYGATQAQTNRVFNLSATETFTHDADGNLTQDGRWTYTWDGENRLIEMKRDTGTPAGARQRLVFEYATTRGAGSANSSTPTTDRAGSSVRILPLPTTEGTWWRN